MRLFHAGPAGWLLILHADGAACRMGSMAVIEMSRLISGRRRNIIDVVLAVNIIKSVELRFKPAGTS